MEIWKTFWERKNKINRLKFKYWIIWLMWMQRKTIYSSIILFHYRGQAWLRCDFFLKIRLFQGLMFYNIINAEMYPFQVFIILTVEKSALFTTSFVFHFQILDLTLKKADHSPDTYTKSICWRKLRDITKGIVQSLEFVTFVFFLATPQHINPSLWNHFWN